MPCSVHRARIPTAKPAMFPVSLGEGSMREWEARSGPLQDSSTVWPGRKLLQCLPGVPGCHLVVSGGAVCHRCWAVWATSSKDKGQLLGEWGCVRKTPGCSQEDTSHPSLLGERVSSLCGKEPRMLGRGERDARRKPELSLQYCFILNIQVNVHCLI